jgi:hypothetical protein
MKKYFLLLLLTAISYAQTTISDRSGKSIIVNAPATTTAKGLVKLTGDLGGTADSPTVPGLATKENTANKTAGTLETNKTSDVKFPTVKAVYDWAKGLFAPLISPSFTGNVSASGQLRSEMSSGAEGGELYLAKSATGSTLAGGTTFDVYENKLRIFENGGAYRGAYLDISSMPAGNGFNLDQSLKIANTTQVTPNMTAATTSGVTYSASSTYGAGMEPWRTGQATPQEWATLGSTVDYWLRIDLGTPTYFDCACIGGRTYEYPGNVVFECSNDGASWFVLKDHKFRWAAAVYHIFPPVKARYFRVWCRDSVAASVNPGLSLCKLYKMM